MAHNVSYHSFNLTPQIVLKRFKVLILRMLPRIKILTETEPQIKLSLHILQQKLMEEEVTEARIRYRYLRPSLNKPQAKYKTVNTCQRSSFNKDSQVKVILYKQQYTLNEVQE